MKYKSESFDIPLPHIHCTLILIFTNDLAKAFEKNNVKNTRATLPDASFIINHDEPLRPEIYVDTNRSRDSIIGILAHEIVHAIEYIWKTLGFPIALGEHEAYMLGYLLNRSIECLDKTKYLQK